MAGRGKAYAFTHTMRALLCLVNPLCWLLLHDNVVAAANLKREVKSAVATFYLSLLLVYIRHLVTMTRKVELVSSNLPSQAVTSIDRFPG